MNSTKNLTNAWLRQGAIVALVFAFVFGLNVSLATATELPAITAPTASTVCVAGQPSATISWSDAGRGSAGYQVNIATTLNAPDFWQVTVPAGVTSVTAPANFKHYLASGQLAPSDVLTLNPAQTYYTRVYFTSTSEMTAVIAFTPKGGCSPTPAPTPNPTPSPSTTCANGSTLSYQEAVAAHTSNKVYITLEKASATQGTAHITNSTGCALPASLISYKMFDNSAQTQTVLDNSGVTTVAPGQTKIVSVALTSCLTQMDIYYGAGVTDFMNGNGNVLGGIIFGTNGQTFGSVGAAQGTFCGIPKSAISNPQVNTFCSAYKANATISWSDAGRGSAGYQVNVATTLNAPDFWQVTLPAGVTSVTAPGNFKHYLASGQLAPSDVLTFNAGQTYYTRVYFTSTSEMTPTITFVPSDCGTPYVPPVQPTQPGALNGFCSANVSSAQIGNAVSWSANNLSGGTGSYTYSWNGDEGLSGTSQTVSKAYNSAGTKNAVVTITSGTQSITRNCNTFINSPVQNTTVVAATTTNSCVNNSCNNNSVNNSNNTTTTNTTNTNNTSTNNTTNNTTNGGGGSYNYDYNNNNLNVSCYANQTSAYVGDNVYWSATVSGGNGGYTYSWSGTDGLYGYGASAYQTYSIPGTKSANLTVYSNGQSVTRTCSVYVSNRYNYYNPITYVNPQGPMAYNGVSLSQVPYTGLESNWKVILFTLALIMWSAIVTYVVVIRRRSARLATAMVSGTDANTSVASDEAQQSARQEILMGHDNMLSNLESYARNQNVIISADALAAVADMAGNDEKRAKTLLSSLANRHSTTGADWTTLDLSKVQNAIG